MMVDQTGSELERAQECDFVGASVKGPYVFMTETPLEGDAMMILKAKMMAGK